MIFIYVCNANNRWCENNSDDFCIKEYSIVTNRDKNKQI